MYSRSGVKAMSTAVSTMSTITVTPVKTNKLMPDRRKENFSLKVSLSITTKRCLCFMTSPTCEFLIFSHQSFMPIASSYKKRVVGSR